MRNIENTIKTETLKKMFKEITNKTYENIENINNIKKEASKIIENINVSEEQEIIAITIIILEILEGFDNKEYMLKTLDLIKEIIHKI